MNLGLLIQCHETTVLNCVNLPTLIQCCTFCVNCVDLGKRIEFQLAYKYGPSASLACMLSHKLKGFNCFYICMWTCSWDHRKVELITNCKNPHLWNPSNRSTHLHLCYWNCVWPDCTLIWILTTVFTDWWWFYSTPSLPKPLQHCLPPSSTFNMGLQLLSPHQEPWGLFFSLAPTKQHQQHGDTCIPFNLG